MNKLPTKQIYLLLIIIIGIIALSVYSTYAIFTLEGQTDNVVSLYTPNSLEISEDVYEYRQIVVPSESSITTDVDIYNNYDYELCYSVWYKIVDSKLTTNDIKVYEDTSGKLSASGNLNSVDGVRVKLLIINNSSESVKINIGVASSINQDTCSLNISSDKEVVTKTISNYHELTSYLIDNVKEVNIDSGYLNYLGRVDSINLGNSTDKIYVAKSFDLDDEIFTLKDYKLIENKELENYSKNDTYYTCLNDISCRNLYQIVDISIEDNLDKNDTLNDKTYYLKKYNLYVGYLSGSNGLRKINQYDYVYYGDNPANFIYYNCQNEQDTSTCELFRILGLFYDNTTGKYYPKIIRNEAIGSLKFNDNDNINYMDSNIYKYLDEEYQVSLSSLKEDNYYQDYLTDTSITLDKLLNTSSKITSNYTIMTLKDYLSASVCQDKLIKDYQDECLKNNYLNNYSYEWTMTVNYLSKVEEDNGNVINDIVNDEIFTVGPTIKPVRTIESNLFRPVLKLKSHILLTDGDGSLENPYQVK